MIAFRASDYSYKSKEMGTKRDFYIVEPVGVPFREYLTVNRQALNEENEFLVNVVFTREPQTLSFKAAGTSAVPASGVRRLPY
jgi:hypothetical protein